MNYVKYEDFNKMDMRVGLIRFIEPVEGTDKLLRFEIDFGKLEKGSLLDPCPITCDCDTECDTDGECLKSCACELQTEPAFGKIEYAGRDIRQIVSGIREFFPEYELLIGKYSLYILNLEPREIRGVMSHGMLMAIDDVEGNPIFLGPQGDIEPGSRVR
ncbi:MAG: tRNA-binding EMAP/Myf-like protein [Crocinitomicaceae bacterium]|jgi:tRNA-binding EMAP/Myf-like protein